MKRISNTITLSFFVFICAISISSNLYAVKYDGHLSADYRSFATNLEMQTATIESRISSNQLVNSRPKFEVELLTYFENNEKSEFYFDPINFAYRKGFKNKSHITIGRFHPLNEMDRNYQPSYLDSIGSNWVINEQNPLNIINPGWLGLGHSMKISKKWNAIFTFSPIFIPTFGPSIYYSKMEPATSRSPFSRTPPTRVKFNDEAYLPLMISLDGVNMKNVVLQNQYFIGFNYSKNNKQSFSLFAYSAPTPTPKTSSDEKLIISDKGVNILVDVNPIFFRENNIGFIFKQNSYSIQALYKSTQKILTISGAIKLFRYFKIGFLHSFNNNINDNLQSGTEIITPIRDEKLLWLKAESLIFYNFKFNSSILKNFDSQNNGMSLNLNLQYQLSKRTKLFANTQVFTGKENSFFGTWRHLDFIATGVNITW